MGGGPTGLYAAYYAGFRHLSVTVVDSLPELGGQVTAMYPEKLIYDVAGFSVVRGRELVDNLTAQADRYHPTYLLGCDAGADVAEDALDQPLHREHPARGGDGLPQPADVVRV